jgi:DNA-binding PadR family transcriptional regulator
MCSPLPIRSVEVAMSSSTAQSHEELLPLKTAWFHILLALSEGALHGFAIRESVEERTGGRVKLYPANLYGSIQDLTELGLLDALSDEEQPDDDRRRQYYELTAGGREVLRLEADRLQQLVDAARASRALAN